MAEQKRIAFLNAFMSVWSVHRQGEPTEIVIEAYWSVLKRYEPEQVTAAFGYALTSLQWFPKPVELISYIEQGPGNIDDIAVVEADKVAEAVKQVGAYESVRFEDPVTNAVVEKGFAGWIKLCELRVDDIKWFRKDFIQLYKAYASQGIKSRGHLSGLIEQFNADKHPDRIPDPVVIGNGKIRKMIEW